MERIEYTTAIETLFIDALGGDDKFALDDNSSVTTIEGINDLFQVGQLFGSIISTEPPATIDTTRGKLTRGNSFALTIKGEAGNDTFGIFNNQATLDAQGGDDDDTFIVRTFTTGTTVSGGAGNDVINYVGSAPLKRTAAPAPTA